MASTVLDTFHVSLILEDIPRITNQHGNVPNVVLVTFTQKISIIVDARIQRRNRVRRRSRRRLLSRAAVQDNTKSRFIFRLLLQLAPAHQILVMVLPKKIWKTPTKSPTTPSTWCVQTKHTRNKFQLGNHVYVIASGGLKNSSLSFPFSSSGVSSDGLRLFPFCFF
jgi:hypothetical protein